jgi:hypothetical protein
VRNPEHGRRLSFRRHSRVGLARGLASPLPQHLAHLDHLPTVLLQVHVLDRPAPHVVARHPGDGVGRCPRSRQFASTRAGKPNPVGCSGPPPKGSASCVDCVGHLDRGHEAQTRRLLRAAPDGGCRRRGAAGSSQKSASPLERAFKDWLPVRRPRPVLPSGRRPAASRSFTDFNRAPKVGYRGSPPRCARRPPGPCPTGAGTCRGSWPAYSPCGRSPRRPRTRCGRSPPRRRRP